jgi:hypothetical protein
MVMNSPQFIVLPGMRDRAREAADVLLADRTLESCALEEFESLHVARAGADRHDILFDFDHKGERFVTFEKKGGL